MKINILNIMILSLAVPFYLSANEPYYIKYGYGIKGGEDEEIQLHPRQWYQTNNIYIHFKLAEDDNIDVQKKYNLYTSLLVKTENKDVIALISFENKSANSYFIRNTSLPYIPSSSPTDNQSICRMLFIISTGDIALDYLGGRCDYRGSFYKSDWYEISPHTKINFKIVLNNNYEFIHKNKTYNIKTSEFTFVKKEWFTELNINEMMLSLLDMNRGQLVDFMRRFNFKGCDHNKTFTINSNEFRFEIDGRKLTSLHTMKIDPQ